MLGIMNGLNIRYYFMAQGWCVGGGGVESEGGCFPRLGGEEIKLLQPKFSLSASQFTQAYLG